ncbi:TetR/AcrR family transcriptional regulator [uncultured Cohaesibacter sp.]|uniref:TetR/AcrR family transcriptional regulator n=1 Tax=uncultured Cohaesibacter sp. TaxID=1002546 RepID=UPI002930FFA8|nr:TetR/AcrR family transcriptional regulator [uncultured Cohaesibacter sp.]
MEHSTYKKLVVTAAGLFRKRGFSATGVSDILRQANLPKGSLYYHFPGGKKDLAIEAAKWSAQQVNSLIDEVFSETREQGGDFIDAAIRFCERVVEVYHAEGEWSFSSISTILLEGSDEDLEFSELARELYASHKVKIIEQGEAYGLSEEEAFWIGHKMMLFLEGGWLVSRVTGDTESLCFAVDCMKEEKLITGKRGF